MKKALTILLGIGLALGLYVGTVESQPTGWLSYLVQAPQDTIQFRGLGQYGAPALIGLGTAVPTAANSGAPPVDGEIFIVTAAAAEPDMRVYSSNSAAWYYLAQSNNGAGIQEANGVWFGTNSVVWEGNVADAGEFSLQWTNSATDVTITVPADNALWAGTGSFMISTLTTNAPQVANSVYGGTNQLLFEGATGDAFQTILTVEDVGADRTYTIPDVDVATGAFLVSTLATNAPGAANSVTTGTNQLIFEGATGADTFQMILQPEDPVAASRTWTLPDYDANAALIGTTLVTNAPDAANSFWGTAAGVLFEGATADAFEITIAAIDPVQDATSYFNDVGLGFVMTTRDGMGGRSGMAGYPNPWRLDFRTDSLANATCQLDDMSAVCGIADTNVDNVTLGGATFEFWNEQAGTALATTLSPNIDGWLIELDDTADEGVQGMFFGADDDFDVGWHCIAQTDACYFEVNFSITDSSETDQVLFGFLVRENYSADAEEDAYDTYCLVGVDDTAADPRSVVISEEVNGDAGANTDTLSDFVDGTNITLRVELDADGTCDVWVDGVETNADVGAAAFDAADFVVPYFSVITSAGDGTPDPDVIIRYAEVGYLN